MTMCYRLCLLCFSLSLFHSCKTVTTYDLAIHNVQVFDPSIGEIRPAQTILISEGKIAKITSSETGFIAKNTIEGKGRLVTPGLIDTHTHFGDLYGNYDAAPEYLRTDSIPAYKRLLSETYLKHGITSIAIMGQPEKWIETTMAWQKNNTSDIPNISITGGALISDEKRSPYLGHIEVMNPKDARKKVRAFYDLGMHHIKLYWRLRQPEMEAAIAEANTLGMNIFAHADNEIVPLHTLLDLGVRNFEHALTTSTAPFDPTQHNSTLNTIVIKHYGQLQAVLHYMLERIQFIEDQPELRQDRDILLQRMIDEQATLSTTIHLFGSIVKRTYFGTFLDNYYNEQNPELTAPQLKRLNKAFDTFMAYIKNAHDRGLKLRLGTDCKEGGKAALSEMLLLHEAGIAMADVFRIATLNGAEALKTDHLTGSITEGKQADLIIFDKNPFERAKHLLDTKTVIKAGVVYQ